MLYIIYFKICGTFSTLPAFLFVLRVPSLEKGCFPYISVMWSLLQLLGVLAQVKMDRDAVEALLKPTDTIDRHVREIQQLEEEVQDLEYKLDSLGQGVKSLEEIQLELNSVQRARYLI